MTARDWVRLADEDGTCDTNQANHERRNVHLSQEFDLGWHLDAACGALCGAELRAIFGHFVDAEFLADWEKAKIEHGNATYERILILLATGVRPEADPDDETFRCSTSTATPSNPPKRSPPASSTSSAGW